MQLRKRSVIVKVQYTGSWYERDVVAALTQFDHVVALGTCSPAILCRQALRLLNSRIRGADILMGNLLADAACAGCTIGVRASSDLTGELLWQQELRASAAVSTISGGHLDLALPETTQDIL